MDDDTSYLVAATMYRQFLDSLVFARGTTVWMMPGRIAEAAIVPYPLAELVLARLRYAGCEPPAITAPATPSRSAHLTILAEPHGADMGTFPDECARRSPTSSRQYARRSPGDHRASRAARTGVQSRSIGMTWSRSS